MKFKLQEKFSKSIPSEIKNYLKSNPQLVRRIIDHNHIDLSSCECEQISTDNIQEILDIPFKVQVNRCIFTIDKAGHILCSSDSEQHDNQITMLKHYPSDLSKAFLLYDTSSSDLIDLINDRDDNNLERVKLFRQGLLRAKDYPKDSAAYTSLTKLKYPMDKSGYALSPLRIKSRLSSYRAHDYLKYIERIYEKIQTFNKIINLYLSDMDTLNSKDIQMAALYYNKLSSIVDIYNNIVNNIKELEDEDLPEEQFKTGLNILFRSSRIDGLSREIKELEQYLSKVTYVDFIW